MVDSRERAELEQESPEERLRRTERLLNEAQRIAKIGSWERDLTKNRGWWSDESYRMFGVAPDDIEITRDQIIQLVHPDDRQRIRDAWKSALEHGESYKLDFRIVLPDGTEKYIDGRGVVTLDESGKPTRLAGTTFDITERVLLEQEVITISERERERIGRELHDSLGQVLTGISFRLQSLYQTLEDERSGHAPVVEQLTGLVQNAVEQTKQISRRLSPAAVIRLGLNQALRALAREVNDNSDVRCQARCSNAEDIHDMAVATHLYRIAQEAVNNALIHGSPRAVEVSFERNGSTAKLEVLDDGIGIAPKEDRAEGIGLRSMAYRTRVLHGRLEVERRARGGTRVSCTCPYSSNVEASG